MTGQTHNTLIFTDMDGTLLDHNTYDFSPAAPMLAILKDAHIPVIPSTSKTKAEMLKLREALGNTDPFIVENGAAVYIPKSALPLTPSDTYSEGDFWVKTFVPPRARWQRLTQELKAQFPDCFKTFTEVGVDGIQAMTGLSRDDAELSSQREYGEPVQWTGSHMERQAFIEAINQADGQVLVGGRFMHISGFCDKGLALTWLTKEYQRQLSQTFRTIAIGDSQNDAAMLDAAKDALIIRSPSHSPPALKRIHGITVTQAYGPSGWVEGLQQLLPEIATTMAADKDTAAVNNFMTTAPSGPKLFFAK